MRLIQAAAAALTLALPAVASPAYAQRAIAHPVLRPVADKPLTTESRTPPAPAAAHGNTATQDGRR